MHVRVGLGLTQFLVTRRLQALAKYAFGLGTVTMVACTLVFTGMSLPPGQGLGTQIMVKVGPPCPHVRILSGLGEPHVVVSGCLTRRGGAPHVQISPGLGNPHVVSGCVRPSHVFLFGQ